MEFIYGKLEMNSAHWHQGVIPAAMDGTCKWKEFEGGC